MSQLGIFDPLAPSPRRPYRAPDGAPRFWFSGVGQRRDIALLKRLDAPGMVSAHRLLDSPGLLAKLDASGLRLTLDSGAFTGGVSLDRYAELLRDVGDRFDFAVSLDVLTFGSDGKPSGADIPASFENWDRLRGAGHPVLYVHHARDRRSLEESTEAARADGDTTVAVGGLVPFLKELRRRPNYVHEVPGEGHTGEGECVSWLARLGAEAEALGLTLHLLGVSSLPVLRCVSTAPWFASADASTWLVSSARGQKMLSRSARDFGAQRHRPDAPWSARAESFVLGALDAVAADVSPVGRSFHPEDDAEYLLRLNLARRFGCDDDTECLNHLDSLTTP